MNPPRRPIRSYVLRQGRVTDAQRRACETLLPRFGVPYSREPLDLDRVFGRAAPKILEIGFGMGETTAGIAAQHPEIDYLGIEVHTPGVGSLLKRIAELGLANVRVIQHDAVEVLRAHDRARGARRRARLLPGPLAEEAPPQAAPDPAAVRRAARLADEARRLRCTSPPTGKITRSGCWKCSRRSRCSRTPPPAIAPRPAYRPLTKFENRGLKLGHGVWDVVFRRVS